MSVATKIQAFFEPQCDWPLKDVVQFQRQRQIQALWIGILAFFLPALLYYGNRTADCFRDTISHSYYIPFWGDVFVAVTCSVGLFLLFYRGQSRPERALALLGGFFAIMVALNPTDGSGCDDMIAQSRVFLLDPSDMSVMSAYSQNSLSGTVHLVSAVLLFVVLAIFNLFVFTATDKQNVWQINPNNKNKLRRNTIYKICGCLMIVDLVVLVASIVFDFEDCEAFDPAKGLFESEVSCMGGHILDFLNWDSNNLTFFGEWFALALFGFAWFVKGRGGGFLLLDENPTQWFSEPWWWSKERRCQD